MEKISHIRVHDRDYNVYICFSYTTLTVHAYKYDNFSIEFEWFASMSEFKEWIQQPIRRL